jgi:Holliday junction resolvase RusA-like endonuclease
MIATETFAKQNGGQIVMQEGPLRLDLCIFRAVPKSYSKKKTAQCLSGETRPEVAPDIDNVYKLVADALNEFIYRDDKQIVETGIESWYVPTSGAPDRLVVRLYKLAMAPLVSPIA